MSSATLRKALVVAGACAVAASPAAASARPAGHHHARGKTGQETRAPRNPVVSYVLKGTVVSADPAAKTLVVTVNRANHHGRAAVGQNVTVDASVARVSVVDRNGDGATDLADVAAGDRVVVQVRLPRRFAGDFSQPVTATRVVVQVPDTDPGTTPAPAPTGTTGDTGSTTGSGTTTSPTT